ncbi:hypothetical protein DFH27DRAFT_609420 [Peziza echinospora]|nr:hypothetical protein DFH27DRAFT_609420 [Peziza echinospora]
MAHAQSAQHDHLAEGEGEDAGTPSPFQKTDGVITTAAATLDFFDGSVVAPPINIASIATTIFNTACASDPAKFVSGIDFTNSIDICSGNSGERDLILEEARSEGDLEIDCSTIATTTPTTTITMASLNSSTTALSTMPSTLASTNTTPNYLGQEMNGHGLLGSMDFNIDMEMGRKIEQRPPPPPPPPPPPHSSTATKVILPRFDVDVGQADAENTEKRDSGHGVDGDLESSLKFMGLDIDLDLTFSVQPVIKVTPPKSLEGSGRSLSSLTSNGSGSTVFKAGALKPIGEGEEDEFLQRFEKSAREELAFNGESVGWLGEVEKVVPAPEQRGQRYREKRPYKLQVEVNDAASELEGLEQEISLVDALRETPRRSAYNISPTNNARNGVDESPTRSKTSSPQPPLHILPRTSSMPATQLRSTYECPASSSSASPTLLSPNYRPRRIHRNPSISSEPSNSSSSVNSKMSRTSSHNSSLHCNRGSIGSKSDLNVTGRLPNAQHSMEGSLSSLRLSRAEEIAISAGIEKDEARAEEKKKSSSVSVRRFAGLVRGAEENGGSPGGEEVTSAGPLPDSLGTGSMRQRGRMWDYMFAQNGVQGDEKDHAEDEVLDPVEVQAMGLLVPLRDMHPGEAARNGGPELPLGQGGKNNENASEEPVKRRTRNDGDGVKSVPERNSILFRLMGAISPNSANQEGETSEVAEKGASTIGKKHKSLRHKISATLLRCIGQSKSNTAAQFNISDFNAGGLPNDTATGTANPSKRWKKGQKTVNHQTLSSNRDSYEHDALGDAVLYHPLQEHIEATSQPRKTKRGKQNKRVSNRLSVVDIFLAMTNGKSKSRTPDAGDLEEMHTDGANDFSQSAPDVCSWNGYSWESQRFKDGGKHVQPGIGNGELVLERDFPEFCRGLRRTKKSYPSLRPGGRKTAGGLHPYLPSSRAANISWTNFLHEFAGSLGHVRESGIRPISDHRKGSSDSLLLAAKTARQGLTLGRSNLSLSSECLAALGMQDGENKNKNEDSEDADGIYAHDIDISHIDFGEGEKEKTQLVSAKEIENADVDDNDDEGEEQSGEDEKAGEEEEDEEEEEEGGSSGYGSNGEGGSSADEDEDSKLRALLRRVGREYVGYGEGKTGSSSTVKKTSTGTTAGGAPLKPALRKPTGLGRPARPRVAVPVGVAMDAGKGGSDIMGFGKGDNCGKVNPPPMMNPPNPPPNRSPSPTPSPSPLSIIVPDTITPVSVPTSVAFFDDAALAHATPNSAVTSAKMSRGSSISKPGKPSAYSGIATRTAGAGMENVLATYGLAAGGGGGSREKAPVGSKLPLPARYRNHVQRVESLKEKKEGKEEKGKGKGKVDVKGKGKERDLSNGSGSGFRYIGSNGHGKRDGSSRGGVNRFGFVHGSGRGPVPVFSTVPVVAGNGGNGGLNGHGHTWGGWGAVNGRGYGSGSKV